MDSWAVWRVSNGHHEVRMTTLIARRSSCCTSALFRVMQGTLLFSRNFKVRACKKKQLGIAFHLTACLRLDGQAPMQAYIKPSLLTMVLHYSSAAGEKSNHTAIVRVCLYYNAWSTRVQRYDSSEACRNKKERKP